MLGKGVHGEVRLGERHEARDAARFGKNMPNRVGYGRETQLVDYSSEEGAQACDVADARGIAPTGVDHPFPAAGRHAR